MDYWLNTANGYFTTNPPAGSEETADVHRVDETNPSVAYIAFSTGHTLILEPMERWPSLTGLAQSLRHHLHAQVTAYAFLVPEAAAPLDVFSAGYDVLVLQLRGEMTWNLHEARLRQINPLYKKNFKFPLTWYGRSGTPVEHQLRLNPGDALYMPRGLPYQALAPRGTCLYLIFRITPLVWMDFLKVAVETAMMHAEPLRRALTPGFVHDETAAERMRQVFPEVLQALQDHVSFDEVLAALRRERIKYTDFPADGHFAQLDRLGELTVDSEVEHRPGVLCTTDMLTDVSLQSRSSLFFGREQVVSRPSLLPVFEYVRDHRRFRVRDLPVLNEEGRVTLVRRLIREGMLRQV